ncbi:VOC family protein (plasmid) [Streptomyces sp. BI20]|uniref:VOC family protein n=1 Tax=Streptomyces sp. BI20 TaxID=3403460 RepID=UPI003C725992
MDPGNVVWFEIATADGPAVRAFYGQLLGWTFAVDPDSSVDGSTYTRIMAPGMPYPMGAVHERAGAREEAMNVSIVSADVPGDQAGLEALGARVIVPATAVSDVTVFARLADPRGNVFSIFRHGAAPERLEEFAAAGREQMAEVAMAPKPGAYAWFEIGTTDARATTEFWSKAFGWRIEPDESAGGKPYSNVFTGNRWPSGGMYDLGPDGVDYLMPDFLVEDVPAVTARAAELGATIEHGPDGNPDGLVYSRVIDPRGNRFGLFSMPTTGAAPA